MFVTFVAIRGTPVGSPNIGALAAGAATIVGTGEVTGFGGATGALVAQAASIDGVGTVAAGDVTATGTLAAGAATIAGSGSVSGAVAIARQAMLAGGTFVNVEDEREAMVPGTMVNKPLS